MKKLTETLLQAFNDGTLDEADFFQIHLHADRSLLRPKVVERSAVCLPSNNDKLKTYAAKGFEWREKLYAERKVLRKVINGCNIEVW